MIADFCSTGRNLKGAFFFFVKPDCHRDTHLYHERFDSYKLKENVRIPNNMTTEKFIQVKCKNT